MGSEQDTRQVRFRPPTDPQPGHQMMHDPPNQMAVLTCSCCGYLLSRCAGVYSTTTTTDTATERKEGSCE